jgi:rRNA maturation RNase YbeY
VTDVLAFDYGRASEEVQPPLACWRDVRTTARGHTVPAGRGPDPQSGQDDVEAEVVVSAERALAEARSRGLPPQGELLLYCIHGLLHLAGYEDATPAGRRRMWRRQLRHLAGAGFRVPGRGGWARSGKDRPHVSTNSSRTESKR